MSFALPRLTLFAVLSAMEEDLRRSVRDHLAPNGTPAALLSPEVLEKAVKRAERDWGYDAHPDFDVLLPYLDFADAWEILNTHSALLPRRTAASFKRATKDFERIVQIRNRVAHSRPLDYQDLSTALEFTDRLLSDGSTTWRELREVTERLAEDPSFVLGLELPTRDPLENHNLPMPDFDETGFIGREETVDQILGLVLGPYPVITVVGEGGLGKTAVALRVGYRLLDHPENPFDAIVFSSSKTTQLTVGDITAITGAISDSLGLLSNVAVQLSGPVTGDPSDEVLEYLAEFRILLVLDNLETVLDDRIRHFLERLPKGSKVLITSRIGIGAFEHPVKLARMSQSDAIQLIRALASVRGISSLTAMANQRIADYCSRMHNNPLWLKWFVSGVQAGSRPEELLARPDRFLDFSMSNVYGFLADSSRLILQAMQSVPGRKSQAELAFLTELGVDELQRALGHLCSTNMVNLVSVPTGTTFESQYELSELPRAYLRRHHSVDRDSHLLFTRRKGQLLKAGEEIKAQQAANPYVLSNLDMRSAGNLAVARHLMTALDRMRTGEPAAARDALDNAKRLAPEWYEVYRVEALLNVSEGNPVGAHDAFEAAIDLEPRSAPLRVRYGLFLRDHLSDPDGAVQQFEAALELDPNALWPRMEIARASLYKHDFDRARVELDFLLDRAARATPLRLKLLHDLHVQYWSRLAEQLSLESEWDRCFTALEGLRRAFVAIPRSLQDSRIRRRLRFCIPVARRCVRHSSDPQRKLRASDLASWLIEATDAEQGGSTAPDVERHDSEAEGTVVRCFPERGFGFIRTASGEDYFFHFSDLEIAEERVKVGESLTFEIGAGRDGQVRAVKVRLDADIEEGA